jgi:DNA gyrase/topoisomerase IV subunit B
LEKPGTLIDWAPDEGVFTDNEIHLSKIELLVEDLSYITPGLEFLIKKDTDKKFKSIKSKGLTQFIEDYTLEKDRISPIMEFKAGGEALSVHCAMVWTESTNIEQSYVNLIPTLEGGTHITALKSVMTREINKSLGSDLKGAEIRDGLVFIMSVQTLEEPVFKGQSKDSLNMPTINAPLSGLLKDEINFLIEKNKTFFEQLEELIQKARKKDEAIAQARRVLSKASRHKNPIPNKLKPALNKTGAELFISEGDSASGSLISHRDIYKHAIMSLRGKPINILKHDLDKVLQNQEVQDIILAMGGFGEDFNSKKCPYEKIIIMADKDADGSHIDLLLISLFYKLFPSLIREGRVYTVGLPLYMVKNGKDTLFIKSELEMQKTKSKLRKDATISRFKGLM